MNKISTLRAYRSCILLLLLGMISIALGSLQLSEISQGNAQGSYSTMPFPVVVHIIFGIIFNLLSPFQFAPNIRTNHPKFHRYSGRLLVVSAIPVVLSALWMNQYFPSYGGTLKYTGIIAYCVVLLGSLFLAIKYVLNKDIQNHRLWMMRAMAAALGPATQRLIIIPIVLIFGEEVVTDRVIGLLIWSGILINLAFVEYLRFRERGLNHQDPQVKLFQRT
jgi:drug/metabolite transporter (DMT)-like permease